MVPLALLLMVQQQTGSYAVAGLASATLGVASAVMAPVLGRVADRRGPRPVLFSQAAAYPLLLALLIAVVLGGAADVLVVGAAALAGMATPLVSGTVRALWSRVDVRVRSTAYALDADRKSTRLNSSHANISYAVFCLKKQKIVVDHFCNPGL